MRPLFRGEGCEINAAGISTAGNPLSRLFDATTGDAHGAQQMREGYLAGKGMGRGRGEMMRPMMGKMGDGGLESAWAEVGPMQAGPMGGGPMPGAAMQDQLMRHMDAAQASMPQRGFFAGAPPMEAQMDAQWAAEFGNVGPQAQMVGPGIRPPGAMAMRPPGADWAAEFQAPAQMQARAAGQAADLQSAFDQAASSSSAGPMQGAYHRPMPFFRPPMPMGGMPMPMGAMPMGQAPVVKAPPPVFAPAVEVQSQDTGVQDSAKPEAAGNEQEDLAQAALMVEMLRNSGNPKFANSKFVNFIDKVSKGDLQFKENTVVDRDGQVVDWDALYDTDAAMATDLERKQLEGLWNTASSAAAPIGQNAAHDPELEEMWKEIQRSKEDFGGAFDQMWGGAGLEAMEDAWRMASEEAQHGMFDDSWMGDDFNMDLAMRTGRNNEYKFQDDNQYLDEENPLALARRLIREGRDREALLALEAEVTKNPESSEGWRMLGQLYAELDQDVEAIQCLRKGHEVDPYNLDSLLALGVSCTNELDQLPALRYLRQWVENHEDHAVLVQGLDPPAEYEYEAWRQQVTQLFNQAAEANPMDADVFVALGVMENINRNYDGAIRALATAARLRPYDHTVWNKLGATLANSGKSEKAVVAYHQGLQLKPNYARSWSNLAIAHANLGQHGDAARFYLSSLVLNPEATHIWSFLHSAVLNMGTVDAYKAIDEKDLGAMTDLIEGVLDPAQLPMPKDELEQPPDEILASMGL